MFGLAFSGGIRKRRGRVELLQSAELFAGCSKKELEFFALHLDEATYPEGAVLVAEGRPPSSFNVILDGEAEVSIGDRPVGRLLPGECTDYETMAEGRPSRHTVRALTPVRVLVASTAQFRALTGRPCLNSALRKTAVRPAGRPVLEDKPA